ncbi:hypothetical protein A3F86_01740 [candidate division WOR-1 bacterium RIFCSPLOWO2_12_FULL_45_9]|uniref:Uncharacterized protein n=1 Tax=candidate division WOR-1 bacterium RIFCSPLOWO2_12_FULL_45_9 TaxID=1802568 RepID=A0A1F4RLS6_UNCSA|nr:MAG: hypothetical protein A3F86_01740 [candidate division WOR-1 bacterium RIFCSPLOWO2_12_FULL_45_9]
MPWKLNVLTVSIIVIFVCASARAETAKNLFYERSIYTDEYGLSYYPDYPPAIGETITLRLRTFKPAQKITIYSDRDLKIPMEYRQGHWWGKFEIPGDYKDGGHFFVVWIRYPGHVLSKSVVWYQAFKEKISAEEESIVSLYEDIIFTEAKESAVDAEEETISLLISTEGEVMSPEASPLVIKGSQSISFKTRTLEGSKEGYTAGTTQSREETLRVNISGSTAGTDIDATLYKTNAIGVSQVGENEEKISILLKRASTEAYLGDFTADLTEAEFAKLNKVLSGARVRGDYGQWGFSALYSSPKGYSKFSRMYGDGTQGPYKLGYSPVVIDSERIYLDGILQSRGEDYTIDYQAGTISFIKKIINTKSVLNIYYDYRQTVYQHATYGLRGFIKPRSGIKLGATYLDDSDSFVGAQTIRSSMSQEAFDPQSHSVVGVDGSFILDNIAVDGEIAYSANNLNILSAASTKESGRAAKFNVNSTLGPLGIDMHVKKIGSSYRPIAEPEPKQAVWEYSGALSFRPGSLFGGKGNYGYEKYTQRGIVYENIYKTAGFQLIPEQLPSLEYNFSEIDESNDPVTGSSIKRVITKNSTEMIHQIGFLSGSLKGTLEKWLSGSLTKEATNYRKVNVGVATVGLDKVTFSSNVELENRQEPGGLQPYRRTYNLNLSATPSKQYFVSSSLNKIVDSLQGNTDVLDLSYRAQPNETLKTDGKYTITSVLEEFSATSEAVSKQAGSFSLDYRPIKAIRLRYLYKPNFTRIVRTQGLSYNNEQQQAEINIIPVQYALLGLIYKLGNSYSIYKSDSPNYAVKENSLDTNSILYTIKMAPFQILSTEFNYLVEKGDSRTLSSTQEPHTYTQGRDVGNKFEAVIKSSLSEKFSIDSRYTYQKIDQGTMEALANLTDTKTHTAALKGIWNPQEIWTFSLSGAYSRTTDYLLSQITYTFSPGAGIIYHLGDKLRVDFEYTYSKSYSGATTEKSAYSLRTKYALSDFVDLTLRADREISSSPNYRLTDITGNVEISL